MGAACQSSTARGDRRRCFSTLTITQPEFPSSLWGSSQCVMAGPEATVKTAIIATQASCPVALEWDGGKWTALLQMQIKMHIWTNEFVIGDTPKACWVKQCVCQKVGPIYGPESGSEASSPSRWLSASNLPSSGQMDWLEWAPQWHVVLSGLWLIAP